MTIRTLLAGSTSLSGLRAKDYMFITVSGNYTIPYDMDVIVHAVGGFANGGVVSGPSGNASGAGAPGYTREKTRLTAGTVLAVAIGAGAAAISVTGAGRVNGNNGGATTVTGGGLSLTANGANGGVATAENVAANGGLGGTASGGDVNFTGGRGGNITALTAATNCTRATGAGAVNLFGFGNCNGGDLTNTTITSASAQATAGATCGANGGSSSSTSSISTQTGTLTHLLGRVYDVTAAKQISREVFGLNSIGPTGTTGRTAGNFAGGDGNAQTGGDAIGIAGGFLAGSGGAAAYGGNTQNSSLGSIGGAAGSNNGTSFVGAAPAGIVLLEILT